MQEQLNGSNKNEPKDAKGPRQGNGVRAYTRWKRDSCNVEPETCNRGDRKGVYDDDPWGKSARFDRTAPAELDQENEGKDRTSSCAGQRPSDGIRDMKKVKKCGNQSKGGDQKATLNVEAHEAEVPIGEFASQRTSEGNNHCRKTDK